MNYIIPLFFLNNLSQKFDENSYVAIIKKLNIF